MPQSELKEEENIQRLPYDIEHIGDPMRGDFEQQFSQYFAINCESWRE